MISIEHRHWQLRIAAAFMVLILTACTAEKEWDAFDPNEVGIVDVEIRPANREETQSEFYVLAPKKRIQPAEAYVNDDLRVYSVPYGCFEAYVDRESNSVLNRLDHIELHDEAGNDVIIDSEVERLFQHIASLQHDMFNVKILVTDDEYFVYREENVNWQTPCVLYHYNRKADSLVELYTWQDCEVVGIQIRSLARLLACGCSSGIQ